MEPRWPPSLDRRKIHHKITTKNTRLKSLWKRTIHTAEIHETYKTPRLRFGENGSGNRGIQNGSQRFKMAASVWSGPRRVAGWMELVALECWKRQYLADGNEIWDSFLQGIHALNIVRILCVFLNHVLKWRRAIQDCRRYVAKTTQNGSRFFHDFLQMKKVDPP